MFGVTFEVSAGSMPFVTTASKQCRLIPSVNTHVVDANLLVLFCLVYVHCMGLLSVRMAVFRCLMVRSSIASCQQTISEWHISSNKFGTSQLGERHYNPQYQANAEMHFCSPNAQYKSLACRMLSGLIVG